MYNFVIDAAKNDPSRIHVQKCLSFSIEISLYKKFTVFNSLNPLVVVLLLGSLYELVEEMVGHQGQLSQVVLHCASQRLRLPHLFLLRGSLYSYLSKVQELSGQSELKWLECTGYPQIGLLISLFVQIMRRLGR